jgi:hypothetical protein
MAWTISRFPELDHLSPAQRSALMAAVPRWTYRVIVWRGVFCGVIVFGAVFGSTRDVLSSDVAVIAGLVAMVATVVALYWLQMKRVRRLMRAEIAAMLKGERPPFCFGCGYDLRGSGEGRCPECGLDVRASCA